MSIFATNAGQPEGEIPREIDEHLTDFAETTKRTYSEVPKIRESTMSGAANILLGQNTQRQLDKQRVEQLQFVELLGEERTPEQIAEVIRMIEDIYQGLYLPNDVLKTCDIKTIQRGGFLFPFKGVKEQLERDLPEKNYFVYGFQDPQADNQLVAYTTGYYRRYDYEQGACGNAHGYKKFILEHLSRINGMKNILIEMWARHTEHLILFDTIGVRKGWEGKGVGTKAMGNTYQRLQEVLSSMTSHKEDEDYAVVSYRFHSIVPLDASGKELLDRRMVERAVNRASGGLFQGFDPIGTHDEVLQRTDDAETMAYQVYWMNEYIHLAEAVKYFKDRAQRG